MWSFLSVPKGKIWNVNDVIAGSGDRMFCISKQTISTPTVEIEDFREVSLRPTEEVKE